MIMENGENSKPSYEELMQAYNNLYRTLDRTQAELAALRQDKVLERLNALTYIMNNKDQYSKKTLGLVEWHINQILAKPQESAKE